MVHKTDNSDCLICCTHWCQHHENADKVDKILADYYESICQANQNYIIAMADISEYQENAPGVPAPMGRIDYYDNGLYLWPELLHDIEELLKQRCPSCGTVYKAAEVLRYSFGPGVTTEIKCQRCEHKAIINKYSDI